MERPIDAICRPLLDVLKAAKGPLHSDFDEQQWRRGRLSSIIRTVASHASMIPIRFQAVEPNTCRYGRHIEPQRQVRSDPSTPSLG